RHEAVEPDQADAGCRVRARLGSRCRRARGGRHGLAQGCAAHSARQAAGRRVDRARRIAGVRRGEWRQQDRGGRPEVVAGDEDAVAGHGPGWDGWGETGNGVTAGGARRTVKPLLNALVLLLASACAAPSAQRQHDVIIRHGTVYDGTGKPGVVADVAIDGDRIAAVGALDAARAVRDVDAGGLAVAPGFIDMLNHSETAFMADGRAQSGVRQGVTLAVFGESSMGPISDAMKADMRRRQGDIKFDITWSTLGEGLDALVTRGVSTNVASFVSASTIRAKEVGFDNRPPTPDELERMRGDVRQAMREGAMGLTTALIYTPAVFAK